MKQLFTALVCAFGTLLFVTSCTKYKEELPGYKAQAGNTFVHSKNDDDSLKDAQGKLLCVELHDELHAISSEMMRAESQDDVPWTIYFNYGTDSVTHPSWKALNGGHAILVQNANLSQEIKSAIMAMFREKYSVAKNWNIVGTKQQYLSAPANKRIMFYIGNMNFQTAIGYTFLNSWNWQDGPPPALIIVNHANQALLSQNLTNAVCHESGHVWGCPHTHQYDPNGPSVDANGNHYYEYSWGWGNYGEFWSGGYVMGNFAARTFTPWCGADVDTIGRRLGLMWPSGVTYSFTNAINMTGKSELYGRFFPGNPGVMMILKQKLGDTTTLTFSTGGSCPLQARFYNYATHAPIDSLNCATTTSFTTVRTLPVGVQSYYVRIEQAVDVPNGFTPNLGAGSFLMKISIKK